VRQPSHTDALAQAQGDSEYFVSVSFFSALLLRMAVIDGAYFGTTFPHLLMMTHPDLFERRPFRAFKPSCVVSTVVAQPWRLEYGR
jgi:hypothetical protein